MTKKEEMIKNFVSYGLENNEAKKEVFDAATQILFALNNIPEGRKLSDKELDQIAGGALYNPCLADLGRAEADTLEGPALT